MTSPRREERATRAASEYRERINRSTCARRAICGPRTALVDLGSPETLAVEASGG